MTGEKAAGVLVCDDNATIRELLRAILSATPDLNVAGEAADGREAVLQAKRLQPQVIMLDLAIPKLSGLEALPQLRVAAPDARIVVFSGFAGETVADEAIALGAASYLEKGADPDAIVATIRQALSQNGTGSSLAGHLDRGVEGP